MSEGAETGTAVIAGPDGERLGDALAAEGLDVTRVEGPVTGETLEAAGLADATLFVLTDDTDPTAVPVAKDINPELRVVVYSRESLPEFVRGQVDIAVDPELLDAEVVAEELVG